MPIEANLKIEFCWMRFRFYKLKLEKLMIWKQDVKL